MFPMIGTPLVIIFMYVEPFTIDIYTKGQIILFYDYMKKNLFIVFFMNLSKNFVFSEIQDLYLK